MVVFPMQAEYFLPALGEPVRTTREYRENNKKHKIMKWDRPGACYVTYRAKYFVKFLCIPCKKKRNISTYVNCWHDLK